MLKHRHPFKLLSLDLKTFVSSAIPPVAHPFAAPTRLRERSPHTPRSLGLESSLYRDASGEGGGGRKNGESKHKEGGCTSEHIEQGSALKGVEMLNCLERKLRDASLLYFEWICYFTQKLTPRHWSTLINTWAVNMLPCER